MGCGRSSSPTERRPFSAISRNEGTEGLLVRLLLEELDTAIGESDTPAVSKENRKWGQPLLGGKPYFFRLRPGNRRAAFDNQQRVRRAIREARECLSLRILKGRP